MFIFQTRPSENELNQSYFFEFKNYLSYYPPAAKVNGI